MYWLRHLAVRREDLCEQPSEEPSRTPAVSDHHDHQLGNAESWQGRFPHGEKQES